MVWLDELPQATFEAKDTLETEVRQASCLTATPARAAAEVCVHIGPRVLYGLLGAQFRPDGGDELSIRVGILDTKCPYAETLLGRWDPVNIGITHEYAEGVIEGAVDEMRKSGPSRAGTVTFNCGAHAEAGSSRNVFRRLAQIVTELVFMEDRQPAPDELVHLFKSTW